MLRIESYVTPIILSYVDKYIKNLKPEDSKVSLWGGDVVFNNLDLKLDVLENELRLPFSFLNGHIHELRIHVPWTKLTSEPIIITINTIECILKLKDSEEGDVESSTHSSKDTDVSSPESRKRQRRQEIETPTSYIQGLINKVINNVIIVFNNVILKYVEDDIVLSINAKTIEFRSVDQKWIPSFIDLTNEDPVLRNVASVTDLTVCLDKRNASGKIEVYQEPLLYQCSLSCRIIRQFESVYSFQPKMTRYDILCPQLHFSLSDTQLPMFIRLMELVLALYYKQLQYQPSLSDSNKNITQEGGEEIAIHQGGEDSWSSWAWSIGSSLNPFEWDEFEDSGQSRASLYNFILHVGIYVDTATWVFKLTESQQENSYGPTKVQFTPFLKVMKRGLFLTAVAKGLEAVNVQMGISSLLVYPIGKCVCGVMDSQEDSCKSEFESFNYLFIESGENCDAYIKRSLFDEETSEFTWNYEILWDDHISNVTVESMLRRTKALGMDYLFTMDIPSDVTSEKLSEINSNPEISNLNAKALCRFAFGSFNIRFNSGFIHRLSAITFACHQSEYVPYASSEAEESEVVAEEEEIYFLESNFPTRKYMLTFIDPCVCLCVAQHHGLDVKNVFTTRRKKRLSRSSSECVIVPVPSATLKFSKIDLEIIKPMYPKRLITIATLMKPISEQMKRNCHLHSVIKLHNCSVGLRSEDDYSVSLLEKFSLNLHFKNLLLPQFWTSSYQPITEISIDADSFVFYVSMPQINFAYFLVNSWFTETPAPEKLNANTLIEDAIKGCKKFDVLKLELQKFESKYYKTNSLYALSSTVERISLALCRANKYVICYIASGPDNSNADDFDQTYNACEKLLKVAFQVPIKNDSSDCVPTILSMQIIKVAIICSQQIIAWLKYTPRPSFRKVYESFNKNFTGSKPSKKPTRKSSDYETENLKMGSSSATISEAKASTKTHFGVQKSFNESPHQSWKEIFIELHPLINSIVICVEVHSWTVFFPIKPLNIPSKSGIVNAVHRLYLTRGEKNSLEDTTVFCLPYFLLQNSTQKSDAANHIRDVPVTLANLPFFEGKDKLPWSLKFSNFQIYSLQGHGESIKLPILKTVNTAATVAVSPKMKGNVLCQLGIVIHLDMSPLDFCGSRRQVETHVAIVEMFLNLVSFYNVLKNKKESSEILTSIRESQHPNDETIKDKKTFQDVFALKISGEKWDHNVHRALNSAATLQEESKAMEQTSTNSQRECSAFLKPADSDHLIAVALTDNDEPNDKPKTESDLNPNLVCVTMWVQWTVARASASLFVHRGQDTKKLKAEIEDFTLWIDLHQVYSKIKCKIATVNIFHYLKTKSEWLKGEKEGIILTVGDQLLKDLTILDPSIQASGNNSNKISNLPSTQPDHSKTRGFLSLTVTVAQCKNIHNKWNQAIRKHLREERYIRECSTPQFLSEVDLRMQSFDCVFYPPILETFASIYEPWFHLQWPMQHFKSLPDSEKTTFALGVNNKSLPLMYVHTEPVRVFLPSSEYSTDKGSQNVILVQLESLLISPQVDNPLSRIILRQDLFTAAEQSRILGVPGAEVEDRQYQMDFLGFSISSGCWDDFIDLKRGRSHSCPSERLGITGENPAYEWNNFDLTIAKSDVLMYPVLARLDTRVIAAPAIVYLTAIESRTSGLEPLLVAGHSLEINALTDCNVFASTQQILLLSKTVSEGFGLISRITNSKVDGTISLSSDVLDSGVDCDASSIDQTKLASNMILEEEQQRVFKPFDFVPLEVLITGNKVSLNVYDKCVVDGRMIQVKGYQKNKCERRAKTKQRQILIDIESTESEASPKRNKKNFFASLQPEATNLSTETSVEEGYEGSEEESVYEMQLPSSEPHVRIMPLIFISVSQPHTFFSLQPNHQKMDVSFFDLLVKSVPKGSSIRATELKKLPNSEDFTTSWLETRPGDSHPKTGIPPAFLTFSAFDFLHAKARVSVDVGRPFRLSFGHDKWEQIVHVISNLEKVLPQKLGKPNPTTPLNSQCEKKLTFLSTLKEKLHRIESISLTTSQIVFNVDMTSNCKSKYELHISLSNLSSSLCTLRKKQKQGSELITELSIVTNIKGLQMKTGFSNLSVHTLVKPWTVKGDLKLLWNQWKKEPDLKVKIESEVLQLELGPESLFCLTEIYEVLLMLIQRFAHAEQSQTRKQSQQPLNELYSDLYFQDDLRAGVFEYISDSTSSALNSVPKPYQVIFNKQHGTMIWCYPEPRALIKMEIYPVPFISANRTNRYTENEASCIRCSLQYFDHIRNSYVTYKRFFLSECKAFSLDLPNVHEKTSLVVSTIWRVCINYDEESNKTQVVFSPEALAACIRVDSLFSVSILPTMQALLLISKCTLTLVNHLDVTGSQMTPPLEGYKLDDSVPTKHAFVTFTLDDILLKSSSWNSDHYTETSGKLSVQVLNYKYLTSNLVLEPSCLSLNISFQNTEEKSNPICVDCNIFSKIICVNLNQSTFHTISVAEECWKQAFLILNNVLHEPNLKQLLPNVLMTNYFIANNTVESIRFGQVNTDENLLLESGAVHFYSWRSQKFPAKLQVCNESNKWKWCEAFSLEEEGGQVCTIIDCFGRDSKFLISCEKISPSQMMIKVNGLLSIGNCLFEDLEVRVIDKCAREDTHTNSKCPNIIALKAQSISPSYFGDPHSLRVKFPTASVWSGEIALNQDSVTVRIPLKKKKEYLSVLCKVYRENIASASRALVVFCPHFIVRSHLPRPHSLFVNTPSNNASQQVTIKGRGHSQPLSCDSSQIHHLTLQLSPELEVSKPPIQISRGLIDQVKNSTIEATDISSLMDNILTCSSQNWPYIDSSVFEGDLLFTDQPKINLQIQFSSFLPNCRSLVIDIRPWVLIINHTGTEILLSEGSSLENIWYIPPGVVFSPPKLENTFAFGVVTIEKQYFSTPLQLSTEEHWYALKFDGKVPKIGSTNISIEFEEKICFFTILSRYEENIQILHLIPTYTISNNTNQMFSIRSFSIQDHDEKVQLLNLSVVNVTPKSSGISDLREVPLLVWDIIQNSSTDKTKDLLYLQVGKNDMYSSPLRLPLCNRDFRMAFTISKEDASNDPFLLTIHPKNSQVKFVIQEDPCPQMMVHNNTSECLVMGQESFTSVGRIEEELDSVFDLSSVPPSKAVFYTFPYISETYPEIFPTTKKTPKLHLALSTQKSVNESEKVSWSHGLNIREENDQFVSIPGFSDVKVCIEKIGHTAHVFIDPANRIEISAKDVRSRIALPSLPALSSPIKDQDGIGSLKEKERNTDDKETIENTHVQDKEIECKASLGEWNNFYFNFKCSDLRFVVIEDVNRESTHMEFLRFTLDNFGFNVRPLIKNLSESRITKHLIGRNRMEVFLSIDDMQIDNQMFSEGNFDFPVTVLRQGLKPMTPSTSNSYDEGALLLITAVVDYHSSSFSTQSLNVSVSPLTLYVEDTLIYYSLKFLSNLTSLVCKGSVKGRRDEDEKPLKMKLHEDILIKSNSMTRPLQISRLHIGPISVLMSIHASVKLYIALDQSPLHFKEYDRHNLITTGYFLGYNLTMHYLSSALFRAGWVVSSLDLLGNPGGFARTVGSGLKDFVQLPFEGILQGPWAFIAGITHGSLSLMKHISTGTLVSVTNLASSVARNMERLSLDEDHLIRNEANRRSKPKGISSSVMQGFSSFGISLLGAVGGLAHQPIQAMLSDELSASRLIGSFGKGMVGVVAKPIGGVADFVVHTGQGLLHGAGWKEELRPRAIAVKELNSSLSNSLLKFIWKFLVSLPKECRNIICAADAMLITQTSSYTPVTVLLTPQVLFIVDAEGDSQQHVFTLHDLKWKSHSHDPTLLYLEKVMSPVMMMNEDAEPISGCPERVADYVRSTYSECLDVSQLENDSNEEEERESAVKASRVRLHLSTQLRSFLTTCIEIVVRSNKGQGFIS